jgi:uncharacterized protein YcaQ
MRNPRMNAMPVTLTAAQARRALVAHLGLNRPVGRGARGIRSVLDRLGCIQLDPLDAIVVAHSTRSGRMRISS